MFDDKAQTSPSFLRREFTDLCVSLSDVKPGLCRGIKQILRAAKHVCWRCQAMTTQQDDLPRTFSARR